jgi:hypothetical protein
MKAKLKVIFEPKIVSMSEVETKLKFIEELPIKPMLNNTILNDLEMEVSFEKNKEVYIHPINTGNVYYTDLDKVQGCEITSNAYCTNIINHSTGIKTSTETYSFFYNKR